MKTQKIAVEDRLLASLDPATNVQSSDGDKIFHFVPAESRGANQDSSHLAKQQRDWSSAIGLIKEASDALRLAEERTVTAEGAAQELHRYYSAEVEALEARVIDAEQRTESADARAAEAEGWLERFHDSIVDGFAGVLDRK